MKITWLGHSCFRFELGASVLLIDPFLKGNPTFEKSGMSWDKATAGVTHIGLTHGHSDHVGDAVEIAKARGATVLGTYELVAWLAGQGVAKVEYMNTGGTVRTPDFALTLVNALHSSSHTESGRYLGNPNGIVVKPTKGPVVYHMGDTDMFSDMALIAAFHKPEIGIVPIGDRFTMGAEAAAFACQRFFTFKTILPCHYGTFPGMLDPDAKAFMTAMGGSAAIRVPTVGEALSV
jgi:L-ascorbate metabolism protein UlaG (beta-lactamase superfamily)